jgi:hypothetical protein
MTPKTFGLPHDEYLSLRRALDREQVEKHFEHSGGKPVTSYLRSTYRNAGLSQPERYRISEVGAATRVALGPSFDFEKDSFERSMRRQGEYERSRGWADDGRSGVTPIPPKYRNEFNQKWHEDEEDLDADQYLADLRKDAPWRTHYSSQAFLDRDVAEMSAPRSYRDATPQRHNNAVDVRDVQRYDSAVDVQDERPQLISNFSTEDIEKAPRRRNFFDRLRRRGLEEY